jgi:hypothetical protein
MRNIMERKILRFNTNTSIYLELAILLIFSKAVDFLLMISLHSQSGKYNGNNRMVRHDNRRHSRTQQIDLVKVGAVLRIENGFVRSFKD